MIDATTLKQAAEQVIDALTTEEDMTQTVSQAVIYNQKEEVAALVVVVTDPKMANALASFLLQFDGADDAQA
jgi:hypothetical protein